MKKQASLVLIVAVVSAGIGAYVQRRHAQQAISKTVATDKSHTTTVIKEVKHKDGTSEKITTVISDRDKKQTENVKIPVKSPKLNVSLLIANDFDTRMKPEYGVSFTKEFIGPITIGGFGLTNGILGVSIGFNF